MNSTLTDRQRAMLAEMGVPLWQPPALRRQRVHAEPGAENAASTARVHPPVQRSTGAPADRGAAGLPEAAPQAPGAAHVEAVQRPESADTTSTAGRAPAARHAPAPAHPPAPAGPSAQPQAPTLTPLPEGIAQMDWTALRAAVAGCTACNLCHGRTQTVFGAGDEQADWMVIGEAPGRNEDRLGEPFVGQAGKLLDHMLAAIGLARDPQTAPQAAHRPMRGVYIANVVKCRPPHNRNPEPVEVATCAPYLKRQIALVQPKIILAMGRFAVQSLLATDEALGRLRGRAHEYEGVPVVVTYHPAYLLRAPAAKAKAWEDLCFALSIAADAGAADAGRAATAPD